MIKYPRKTGLFMLQGDKCQMVGYYKEAFKWYLKAAKKGNGYAQEKIFSILTKHIDAYLDSGNYSEALMWYNKAAKVGNTYAYYKLGLCYENGYGVKQSLSKAIKWYKKGVKSKSLYSKLCEMAMEKHGFSIRKSKFLQ